MKTGIFTYYVVISIPSNIVEIEKSVLMTMVVWLTFDQMDV